MLPHTDTSAEHFDKIARAAAKLVDTIYEFDFDPTTAGEQVDYLDDLLIDAGYRPAPEKGGLRSDLHCAD